MDTAEILKRASELMDNLSADELVRRTHEAGIKFDGIRFKNNLHGQFIFDLNGLFPEVANAKSRWVSENLLKRKSISLENKENKGRKIAALSFCN